MARNGIPNPFNPMDPDWRGKQAKPKRTKVVKRIVNPSSRVRAASIGVSSSSRQRTHKRGPHNRSR
jgi:hypothetical protein